MDSLTTMSLLLAFLVKIKCAPCQGVTRCSGNNDTFSTDAIIFVTLVGASPLEEVAVRVPITSGRGDQPQPLPLAQSAPQCTLS